MEPRVIVHLVHGTWGRGLIAVLREDLESLSLGRLVCRLLKPGLKDPLWFEPRSPFRGRVLEKLEPTVRDELEFHQFLWSGSNSVQAREHAAQGLRRYLEAEFSAFPRACHLLIAHSHGGIVAFDAVTERKKALSQKLNGILTLGTPYLAFEADTENEVKLIVHGLLPMAVILFFLALLGTLIGSALYSTAVWLAAMLLGLSLTLFAAPRIADRRVISPVAEVILFLCCGLAMAGAFSSVFSWVSLTHPADSTLGVWERAGRYIFGAVASGLSLLALFAARAAATAGPPGEAFMLRDTVMSLLAFIISALMCFTTVWALLSYNPWFAGLATFIAFWPYVTLFATVAVDRLAPFMSRRAEALAREVEKRKWLPELACPLYAIRLPGDEASLAIAASQIAREASNLSAAALRSFSHIKRIPKWLSGFLSAIGVASGIQQMWALGSSGWYVYVFGPVLGVAELWSGLFVVALFLVASLLCFSLLTFGFLALAVGPDVIRMLPAFRVDCEPLPRCASTDQCRFELHWVAPLERAHLSLRHSLYELEAVQQRIAEWINVQAKSTRADFKAGSGSDQLAL